MNNIAPICIFKYAKTHGQLKRFRKVHNPDRNYRLREAGSHPQLIEHPEVLRKSNIKGTVLKCRMCRRKKAHLSRTVRFTLFSTPYGPH